MKILILLLLFITNVFAIPSPPAPAAPGPPGHSMPPPALSINDSMIFFVIMALVYGIYIVYRNRNKLHS